jgi:6-phosphogluconate dehydrogenase-like protein
MSMPILEQALGAARTFRPHDVERDRSTRRTDASGRGARKIRAVQDDPPLRTGRIETPSGWDDGGVESKGEVMKVGFIGLGHMGAGMAANLLRAGHEVTIYLQSHGRQRACADRARCPRGH